MKDAPNEFDEIFKSIRKILKDQPSYPQKGGILISDKDEEDFTRQINDFSRNYVHQYILNEIKKMIYSEDYSDAVVLAHHILLKLHQQKGK